MTQGTVLLLRDSTAPSFHHPPSSRGFTLLELLLAVAILAAITGITYMTFSTVITAWQKGTRLMEDLHHGDFVVEQLVMGLRSAYFPDVKGGNYRYGFQMEDGVDGSYGGDRISWVKLGRALVGDDWPFADTPHRVVFRVTEDDEGRPAASVRAWRLHGQPEEFDPDSLEPIILSRKVVGFDCRCAHRLVDGEIEWLDEWSQSNRVPTIVEVTLYLEAVEEGGEPQALRRAMGLPAAAMSWQ